VPLVVRDRDGRPQEDPLVVHCFCVCGGGAPLGDLSGVNAPFGSGVVKIDPLRFLAGCRTRQLNQA